MSCDACHVSAADASLPLGCPHRACTICLMTSAARATLVCPIPNCGNSIPFPTLLTALPHEPLVAILRNRIAQLLAAGSAACHSCHQTLQITTVSDMCSALGREWAVLFGQGKATAISFDLASRLEVTCRRCKATSCFWCGGATDADDHMCLPSIRGRTLVVASIAVDAHLKHAFDSQFIVKVVPPPPPQLPVAARASGNSWMADPHELAQFADGFGVPSYKAGAHIYKQLAYQPPPPPKSSGSGKGYGGHGGDSLSVASVANVVASKKTKQSYEDEYNHPCMCLVSPCRCQLSHFSLALSLACSGT